MATLILDIETVGEDFDSLDETTQDVLTRWIKKESSNEDDYQEALQDLKNGLGLSPLTGQIVAIGVLDAGKTGDTVGAVYYQSPGNDIEDFEEEGIKFSHMTEKEMLEKFWAVVEKYDEFVTFNGRPFDVPFIMIRSAIQGVKPTKNLMSNRYLSYQPDNAKHIDLLDQLTFYGTVRRKGSLHLWSRAFNIDSPKASGVAGDDVGRLFKQKKFLEIAKYNVGDLYATKKLYNYWKDYISFE